MRLAFRLVLGIAVAVTSGCATAPRASGGAATGGDAEVVAGMSSATLIVHGMSCPLCASNVDKQLLEVPGVKTVAVNMQTGHVAITMDPARPPTRAALAAAIDRSGFTLAEVRTP